MSRTQKNKATSGHLGLLKAKLAKLRRELIAPTSGGGPKEGITFYYVLPPYLTLRSQVIII